MTKQEQIEEMVDEMTASNKPFVDIPIEIMPKVAETLYNAGFRKIFMSDIIDAQKALKAGYDKGYNDGFDDAYRQGQRDGYDKGFENARSTVRNETAKEIVDRFRKYESYFDDYEFDRILDDIEIDYGIEGEKK